MATRTKKAKLYYVLGGIVGVLMPWAYLAYCMSTLSPQKPGPPSAQKFTDSVVYIFYIVPCAALPLGIFMSYVLCKVMARLFVTPLEGRAAWKWSKRK